MALHELATNAAKYGALSAPDGSVKVRWDIERRKLRLDWREEGGPPVSARPKRRGFRSTLIERGLAYQLDGEARLHFDVTGVRFVLEVPLDSVEARA